MDNNKTQDQGKKPKNNKKIIFIIIAIVIVVAIAITVFCVTSGIFTTKDERPLKTDEDVISYLENKYKDDSFEILSKETNKWKVKSNSGYYFYVEENLNEKSNEYTVTDGLIMALIDNITYNYKSTSFKADSTHKDNTINIYKGDTLLDVFGQEDEETRRDLIFLCMSITNHPTFKSMSEEDQKNNQIFYNYKSHNYDTVSQLFCDAGDNSFRDLLK